jgi:hypothetical protein
MIGYGCPEPIDILDGLSLFTNKIVLVKDNNGAVYLPEFNYDAIESLNPGYGYKINVSEGIDDFSLCDWYVNDIPEDNIVSLQEENASLAEENTSLQEDLDSIYGCMDISACNYDETAVLDDGSCYNNDLEGLDCEGNQLPLYQVGDLAEGGIVFYVDETGEHGLVAGLEDLGEMNWNDAMNIAINLTSEGFNDWYLPSIDELELIYNTLGNGGPEGNIGNFEPDWYWSSTENFPLVFDVNFSNGNSSSSGKDASSIVLAIRAF